MTCSLSLSRVKPIAIVFVLLFVANAQEAPTQESHGIGVADLDRSVKPGDNFYEFCNGAWMKRTEMPADRPSVSVSPCSPTSATSGQRN
jgi:putative endopeptidase